ncbi:alpha/beta hydrolase [Micromonospora sp. NPDC093277]|uniref:alpha/beta hydrolase n=1 Tax=Micromonospora sp. NPDC093277 TaxID=3364291 RepID=UPI0038225F5C
MAILPIGYVVSVALLAFCTATAVIGPRSAHTTQSYWGFWVTYLINELPFLALYALAASTVLAFVQGDLAAPGGLVAFAVAVLTAAGLAVLIRRALATGAVLRRALADDAGIELPPSRRPWAHILLAPFAVRRRDVVRVGNIAYGDAGRRNLLDVYHHRDRPTGGSVLVYFHGGGFRMGHKRWEGRALLHHLAAQGWVCVSANYRLAPAHHFPDAHIDAKRVIAWVRSHAADHGGDPRTIIVSGSSAGAHLASMIALTPNDPAFQPGFESADTSVAAAIGLYGYYGRVAGPNSSPLDRLRAAPPFLFLHGDKDSLTLVEDTHEFVTRLREASTQPVVYAELPGAQHTFDLFYSLRYRQIIEAVTAFGAWLHTTQPHSDRPAV